MDRPILNQIMTTFTVNGVKFQITGTFRTEDGWKYDIKNLSNGKRKYLVDEETIKKYAINK